MPITPVAVVQAAPVAFDCERTLERAARLEPGACDPGHHLEPRSADVADPRARSALAACVVRRVDAAMARSRRCL
jgi:hypothetical protein